VSGFVIRRAAPGDAAALVDLARAVVAEPGGWLLSDEGWRSVSDERRYLRGVRHSPDATVLVAESNDGGIVGRLSVARDQHPSCLHVADIGIMVAAAYRRQGLGRALLEAAIAWARQAGVRKLELHVFPHNEGAIALYEQLGFEKEGYRHAHFLRAGVEVDAVLMALLIR
jgi:RimJ/RimL family protein N-acetyltransferase